MLCFFHLKDVAHLPIDNSDTKKNTKPKKFSAIHFRSNPVRISSMNFYIFAYLFYSFMQTKMNADNQNMKGFKLLFYIFLLA